MGEYTMKQALQLHNEGVKVHEIARRLEVSRRTVYNYVHEKVYQGTKRGRPAGVSKLSPFHGYIDAELEKDLYVNGEVLFEKLRKWGYTGGRTIVGDYLRTRRAVYQRQAVFRFETYPGCQAQVDWCGPFWFWRDGIARKRYCFIMKAGYSRRCYMEFTESKQLVVLLACLGRGLAYFGGVFSEVLFDNEKTMFLYDGHTQRWYAHPRLMACACHYGFTPKRCRLRRPHTKGKVEREVRYLRCSFFSWVENAHELPTAELNEKLHSWLAAVDTKLLRELGETRQERFKKEAVNLGSLPAQPFDHRAHEQLHVDREGRFRYNGNRYSVPADYIASTLDGYYDPDTDTMQVYQKNHYIKTVRLQPPHAHQCVDDAADRASVYRAWKKARDAQQTRAHRAAQRKKRRAAQRNSVQDPALYDKLFGIFVTVREEVSE